MLAKSTELASRADWIILDHAPKLSLLHRFFEIESETGIGDYTKCSESTSAYKLALLLSSTI
jgi:hypothetical protein